MNIKVKVWIEDKKKNLLFGSGKTQILTNLDSTGCVSQTAKLNNMTDDKVLNHIQILDNNVEEELVLRYRKNKEQENPTYMLSVDAREILQAYEILQYDVEKYAKQRFKELYSRK